MKARARNCGYVQSSFHQSPSFWRGSGAARLIFACVSTVVFVLPTFSTAFGQSKDNSEYRVKLAFLYNFAQFVQWPVDAFPQPAAPLTICVVGENPFDGEIEQSLRGRTIGGHPLKLIRLSPEMNPRSCQMIFVRAGEMKSAARFFALSRGSNTLTVGEATDFAKRGGIINLVKDENRLRFEINIEAAGQTRLKISSKLLSLARIVAKD